MKNKKCEECGKMIKHGIKCAVCERLVCSRCFHRFFHTKKEDALFIFCYKQK